MKIDGEDWFKWFRKYFKVWEILELWNFFLNNDNGFYFF